MTINTTLNQANNKKLVGMSQMDILDRMAVICPVLNICGKEFFGQLIDKILNRLPEFYMYVFGVPW